MRLRRKPRAPEINASPAIFQVLNWLSTTPTEVGLYCVGIIAPLENELLFLSCGWAYNQRVHEGGGGGGDSQKFLAPLICRY